jgi:DNA-binding response OmpR family regulator
LHEKDYSYLQVIKRNAERMQNQIQQLMEFRKAETGHLSLHYECIDVVELVKYTLDSFTDMASQNKIDLIINLSPQVPRWVTDRDMLEKVIFNLVSNAFKYTPDEGKISITLSVESNELCFQVTNSGLGIKFEEIPLLFNRFKVLDNFESKLSKGIYTRTGIGLAMCRNLVELLNGTISVDSKMKEYTTFRVLLPQQPESLLNPTTSKGNIETNNASPTFSTKDYLPDKKYTILIVDDQAEIRSLIKDILSDFNTCETENGKDALAEIQNNLPDLIVCDILMPVMDGIEFLKILKQQKETAHIPVILLSSRNSIESQIEGLEIGAQMFLSKPFHPTHLLAMVNRSLNSQLITKSYLESPQAHAEQFMGRSIDKQDKEFICEVIELLQKNLDDETYNQDALANDMAVSRMQLYRKIKTITVNTPAEFIRNFRLHEVEKLLKNTSKTVQEIMIDCGFHNKAYFYREFSKVYKCTPKEYRNKSN